MNKRQCIIMVFLCSIPMIIFSQELTLFSMQNMPHTQFVNPATQPHYDCIIGMPLLSTVSVVYNNDMFSINEILTADESGTGSSVDGDKLVNNFSDFGYAQASVIYTPLFFGLRRNKNYFTFSINELVNTYNIVPQSALELLWNGNGGLEEVVPIDGTRANMYHIREFAFGLSTKVTDRITIGAHFKYLSGKGNVYTTNTTGYVSTNPSNYDLLVDAHTTVETALPIRVIYDENGIFESVELQNDEGWITDYFFQLGNRGLGFDFGVNYEVTDNITISASLLNMGFVSWRNNTNTFTVDDVVTFDGFQSLELSDETLELDSIVDQLLPDVTIEDYTSYLDPQAYFGLSYVFAPHLQASGAAYFRLIKDQMQPAYSLSVQTVNYNRYSAALSYNVLNGDYFSVGAGVGVQLGYVHLHMMTDNLLGYFNLANQRSMSFRFGLSFIPKLKAKKSTSSCGCFTRLDGRH